MSVHLREKCIVSTGQRHKNECYSAVISDDGKNLAFLRVNGKRESLVVAGPDGKENVVVENTYVLSHVFAGGNLFWSERKGKDWKIQAVSVQNLSPTKVSEPFSVKGRPASLNVCKTLSGSLLVWEERLGKSTRIRAAEVNGENFGNPFDVTDGSFNVYDPASAMAEDGRIFVAYNAFYQGNYRILFQVFDLEAKKPSPPMLVTNSASACFYPSVCARKKGGVWFSYVTLSPSADRVGFPFVTHFRRQAHHAIFQSPCDLQAGIFDGEKCFAPLAAPPSGARQGNIAAMQVFSGKNAGHSQVFEDEKGRLRILFRQHNQPEEIVFEKENKKLTVDENKGISHPQRNHPDICMVTLEDCCYCDPVRIIKRAHVEAPVSAAFDGKSFKIAFTEDRRRTGWNVTGEWFDSSGETGVGKAVVELSELTEPDYDIRPFLIFPVHQPDIEEPSLKSSENEVIYAMGQTHAHSVLSVCRREANKHPDINYRFMQDVQHLDFGAIADHAYNMWHTEMLITRKLAEYYYFPGEFVAIPAYEWTASNARHEGGPFGHMNPLWLEEDGDLEFYAPTDPDCEGATSEKMWASYRGKKVVTPPHHPADALHFYNWDYFDPEFVSVMEIFQDMRGSGEKPDAPGVTNFLHQQQGHWVVDHLKKGKKFGFIGGADHSGMALAGVPVKELTRTALYNAFRKRKTFATTGISARLYFSCNESLMGAEVETEKAAFSFKAAAAENIKRVQVVRNGDDLESIEVNQKTFEQNWDAVKKETGEFWYVRVIFENGEMAWSSPIWLR